MICRPRRVLAAEAVKPPVFISLSVPREFQVMKAGMLISARHCNVFRQ